MKKWTGRVQGWDKSSYNNYPFTLANELHPTSTKPFIRVYTNLLTDPTLAAYVVKMFCNSTIILNPINSVTDGFRFT